MQKIKEFLGREKAMSFGRVWKRGDSPSPVPYNKMKKYLFFFGLLFLFLLIASPAWGATYYVKNAGSDSNSGLSDALAWQTISKVNGSSFSAGDSILFNKGDTWREQLNVPSSGSAGSPITFGAYGSGALPIINGSNLVTGWDPWGTLGSAYFETGNMTEIDTVYEYLNGTFTNSASAKRSGVYGALMTLPGVASGESASGQKNFTGGAQTQFYTKFYMNFDNVTWLDGAYILVFQVVPDTGAAIGELYLYRSGNNLQFRYTYRNGTDQYPAFQTFSTVGQGWHEFQITMVRESGNGAADGILTVIADSTTFSVTGITGTYATTWTGAKYGTVFTTAIFAGTIYLDDLISNTTSSDTNVWLAICTSANAVKQVFLNSTRGTKVASAALCNGTGKWYWGSNVLYVYSTTDPDTAYVAPGIEASVRDYGILVDGKNYVKVQNFEVFYANDRGIQIGRTSASTNNSVSYCSSHHNLNAGIDAEYTGTTANLIEYNSAYLNGGNDGVTGGDGEGVGIEADQLSASSTIRYNLVYNNYGGGIQTNKSGGNRINYNVIYGNGIRWDGAISCGAGIFSFASTPGVYDDNQFYNNVIYNNGGGGIRLDAIGQTNLKIKNNILMDNQGIVGPYTASTGEIYFVSTGTWTGLSIDNNIYFESAAGWFGPGTYYFMYDGYMHEFGPWKTHMTGQDANSSVADPLFVSVSDFHLQAGSPAINAGVDVGLTGDYDNVSLPRGAGFEIGAYEYPVPVTPAIGTPSALTSSSIRWNLTDNANDETAFELFDSDGNHVATSSSQNLTYINETGLSENTQYTRKLQAWNSYGYSTTTNTAALYTLTDAPTNLSGTAGLTTMDLSVDSFTNPTADSSGYFFSRSGANSGWLQTNSWSDSGLPWGTSYNYSVIYRNGDGTETSAISTSAATHSIGGGVSDSGYAPVVPAQTAAKPAQIAQAPSAPSTAPVSPVFTANLKAGMRGNEIKQLQLFLNKDPDTRLTESGLGSPGNETSFFGILTYTSVIKFQEKYAKDILAPWDLTKGTGFVGKTTRAKINEMMGR